MNRRDFIQTATGLMVPASMVGQQILTPIVHRKRASLAPQLISNQLILNYDCLSGVNPLILYDRAGTNNANLSAASHGYSDCGLRLGAVSTVSLPTLAALNGNSTFTVQLLFRAFENTASGLTLWCYGTNSNNQGLGIGIAINGSVRYFLWGGDTDGSAYKFGEWVVLTITRSGSTGALYKNKVKEFDKSFGTLNLTGSHLLGGLFVSPWNRALSEIGSLAIYSRVLTPSEISANVDSMLEVVSTRTHKMITLPEYSVATNLTPIVDVGADGTWDDVIAGDPWMVGNRMYYYGHDGAISRSGFADSPDGLTFTKYAGNPILDGVSDNWAGKLVVVQLNGTYYGYYEAGNLSNKWIALATSSDGITWTKYDSGNAVISPGIEGSSGFTSTTLLAPAPFVNEGVIYLLYGGYTTGNKYRIFCATTTDGTTFTRQGLLLEPSTVESWDRGWIAPGNIIRLNNKWVMVYNAGRTSNQNEGDPTGIGLAYSNSLLSGWTKYAGNPIVCNGGNRTSAKVIWRGHIVPNGNKLRLYFNAGDGSKERIFTTLSL